METFLSQKLPGKGPPKQLKTMVASWAKKGQIKREELAWSGLNEWLEDRSALKRWVDQESGLEIFVDENGRYNLKHSESAFGESISDGLSGAKENAEMLVRFQEEGYEFDPLTISDFMVSHLPS